MDDMLQMPGQGVDMSNPYQLPDGNVQISFSGGRTSAYMLHRILEANGDLRRPGCGDLCKHRQRNAMVTRLFRAGMCRQMGRPHSVGRI